MKIAILKKPYCIEIEDQKLRENLNPDEIRAKTIVSALKLGTDRGNFEGAEDVPGAPTYPRWVGDSNIAVVEEVGSNVKEFKVGDRVISQNPHQSEWIASQNTNICVVPEGVKNEDAVWSTLYTLSGFCFTKAGFIPGENVAVVGLGILGLGAVGLGPLFGAKNTIAIGNSEVRNEMAKKMGADHAVLSNSETLEEELDQITNGAGVDLVILTANPWDAYISSLRSVRPEGRISIVALSGRGEEDKAFNATLEPAFNDNPEVGTVGIYEKYTRLTFVCYLREKISKCPDHKDLSEHDLAHLTKSGHSKIQHPE